MKASEKETITMENETKSSSDVIRLSRETKKLLVQWIRTANKKIFGRRVTADDLIGLSLKQLSLSLIKEIQEGTLSNLDRIEREYREYVNRHGPTKKDVFMGKLLNGEITSLKPATH